MSNLTPLFKRLKKILTPYAPHFTVRANTPTSYELVGATPDNPAKRFGAVTIRQNHVTFYSCPAILKRASPALRQQMRGATASVSLTTLDESLIEELATLTATRYQNYRTSGTF